MYELAEEAGATTGGLEAILILAVGQLSVLATDCRELRDELRTRSTDPQQCLKAFSLVSEQLYKTTKQMGMLAATSLRVRQDRQKAAENSPVRVYTSAPSHNLQSSSNPSTNSSGCDEQRCEAKISDLDTPVGRGA